MLDVTKKQPTGLRLEPELIQRIESALERYYTPLPLPSRNSVLEAWVMSGLEQLEQLVDQREQNQKETLALKAPSRELPSSS
jgi:hypothetical protein